MTKEFDAMTRLESEDKIPIKQAINFFEGSPSVRTVQNYVTRGLYVPSLGGHVFLEAYRGVGMSLITSKQAIQRFRARINGGE